MNKTGIDKQSYGNKNQILAVVDVQVSFSCKVNATAKILPGTPVKGNLANRATAFDVAGASDTPVGVLLHDVEPNKDAAIGNGTVLVFGWVYQNRVDATVKALYTAGMVTKLNAAGVTIVATLEKGTFAELVVLTQDRPR